MDERPVPPLEAYQEESERLESQNPAKRPPESFGVPTLPMPDTTGMPESMKEIIRKRHAPPVDVGSLPMPEPLPDEAWADSAGNLFPPENDDPHQGEPEGLEGTPAGIEHTVAIAEEAAHPTESVRQALPNREGRKAERAHEAAKAEDPTKGTRLWWKEQEEHEDETAELRKRAEGSGKSGS